MPPAAPAPTRLQRRTVLARTLALPLAAALPGGLPLAAQGAAVAPSSAPATASAASSPPAAALKTLRVMMNSAETSFDPARIIDLYSRTITAHIFESLYGYDALARPARVVPVLALGMPEASTDFRVWTVRLRPGIFFADDPV